MPQPDHAEALRAQARQSEQAAARDSVLEDLKALEELEIQINSVLRELRDDVPDEDIPDIEEKIKALEEEIDKIISTDPYQYKFLLEDEEKVQELKEDLSEELDAYSRYEKQLKEILRQIISGGARFTWEN